MEHLGGLIHRMPLTAFAFLVGCVAISALPPLNGFVSEWLTFQAILLSPDLPQWGLKLLVPAVGALLALSAALAAACFVKAFGVDLPRPAAHAAAADARARSTASRSPRCSASPRSACWPASFPGLVIDALAPVVQALVGEPHAGAGAQSPGCRSCRSPRAAAPTTACSSSCSSRSRPSLAAYVDPPLRLARAAPRAGLGLRLSRSEPGDPVHRRQLRPADPPRVRHAGLPRPRAGRHAAARRHARRRGFTVAAARPRLGRRSTRRSRGAVGFVADRLNRAPVPDHPPLSQPRLRRARRPAPGARAMAVILDLARPGRADGCWCCCWRRCSPASCAR